MKKRYYILSFILLAGAFWGSVKNYAQPYYGFRISGGWANVSITSTGSISYNTKPIGYFSAGVFAEYPMSRENMYFEPSLMLSRKGFNLSFFYNFHLTFYYLEAPLMFDYRLNNFTLGAGPYFALGLTGNLRYTGTDFDGNKVDENERYYPILGKVKDEDDDKLYFNMLDLGINLGVSYQIDRYRIGFYFSRGFLPVNAPYMDDEEDKIFNKVFYFSASYYFNF